MPSQPSDDGCYMLWDKKKRTVPGALGIWSSSPGRLVVLLLVVAAIGLWQWWRADGSRETHPPLATPASTTAPAPVPDSPGSATSGGPMETREARRDLTQDESRGGHTLARHVGRTDEELRERLARERGISAASTYGDRATAETVVARTLAQQSQRVATWAARRGNRPNLALNYRGARTAIIGRSLRRGQRESVPSTDAIVVLRWDGRGGAGGGFFVLTSYPEARR